MSDHKKSATDLLLEMEAFIEACHNAAEKLADLATQVEVDRMRKYPEAVEELAEIVKKLEKVAPKKMMMADYLTTGGASVIDDSPLADPKEWTEFAGDKAIASKEFSERFLSRFRKE